MYDLIHRIAACLRLVFAPGTGMHRRSARLAQRPDTARRHSGTAPRPPAFLRLPRSPYHLDTPLDGDAVDPVRPYLVAHERERERARQAMRRLALVLAADFGIDLDQHLIGAREMAA